mmetsp:Transcript_23366/g.40995  ORF Transcript_23366/g.40995 Transcript_23366/m.40995 type:complete len:237 (+) Transcript_23366:490-1200(+)
MTTIAPRAENRASLAEARVANPVVDVARAASRAPTTMTIAPTMMMTTTMPVLPRITADGVLPNLLTMDRGAIRLLTTAATGLPAAAALPGAAAASPARAAAARAASLATPAPPAAPPAMTTMATDHGASRATTDTHGVPLPAVRGAAAASRARAAAEARAASRAEERATNPRAANPPAPPATTTTETGSGSADGAVPPNTKKATMTTMSPLAAPPLARVVRAVAASPARVDTQVLL